jgi:hypothetical protein
MEKMLDEIVEKRRQLDTGLKRLMLMHPDNVDLMVLKAKASTAIMGNSTNENIPTQAANMISNVLTDMTNDLEISKGSPHMTEEKSDDNQNAGNINEQHVLNM